MLAADPNGGRAVDLLNRGEDTVGVRTTVGDIPSEEVREILAVEERDDLVGNDCGLGEGATRGTHDQHRNEKRFDRHGDLNEAGGCGYCRLLKNATRSPSALGSSARSRPGGISDVVIGSNDAICVRVTDVSLPSGI